MTFEEWQTKSKNSIRPITFYRYHDKESCYNYWLGGTGFFLKYGEIDIFITVRHVFEKSETISIFNDNKEKIESFFLIKELDRIQDFKDSYTRVPIKAIYMHSVPFNDSNTDITGLASYDTNDIAIIELYKNQKNTIFRLPTRLAIKNYIDDENNDTEEANIGDKLIVRGHPSETNYYDYIDENNSANLYLKQMHLEGIYTGRSNGIGTIEISEDCGLSEYRGFSGSPVFKVNSDESIFKLAGILIRGSKKSKKVFFITMTYLYMYLIKTDISAMFLGLSSSDEKVKSIINTLEDFGITNIKTVGDSLIIQLFNGNHISIKPIHEYVIHALYIILKYPDIANEENIYLIQELIVLTHSDKNILKILYSKAITMELLEEIKNILLDYEVRNNIEKYLEDNTLCNRLLRM